jgi:hypothetical protein
VFIFILRGVEGRLTEDSRRQPRRLFHEAVEIRHVLVDGPKDTVAALLGLLPESVVVFGMSAQVIDDKLRDLSPRQHGQESEDARRTTGTWNALANRRPSVTLVIARGSVSLAILADHLVRWPSP